MKQNLIFIARANNVEDQNFHKLLFNENTFLPERAVILIFTAVAQFKSFIESMHSDYEFGLFVHMGNQPYNVPTDGDKIAQELEDLKWNGLKYEFTSRTGDNMYKKKHVRHTPKLLAEEYPVETIPVNRVGDILRRPSNAVRQSETILAKNESLKGYDFAVITALFKDEHTVFISNMKTPKKINDFNLHVGKFSPVSDIKADYRKNILLTWQSDMGSVDAAAVSSRIISKYDPKFLIMAGVCGGLEGEVNLYDIIIPRNVHDYMSGKFKAGVFEPAPIRADADGTVIQHLVRNEDRILEGMKKLAKPLPSYLLGILNSKFKIHFDNYACGPWVVKTKGKLYDIARQNDVNIVGLEMESLGVLRASKLFSAYNRYGLVVKSVMDFTDENKTDGDKGIIKNTAAYISYLCVRAMMPILMEFKDPKMK